MWVFFDQQIENGGFEDVKIYGKFNMKLCEICGD